MRRTPFKKKITKPMKRTKIRVKGHSTVAELRDEIQSLVRDIVMLRDGGCILRKHRLCGGEIGEAVIQADHLITRSNSATYADTRLIVCLCKRCHGWKHWYEKDYDRLVKTILSPERVKLWEKCEEDRSRHITHKPDWKLEIISLKQERDKLRNL